MVGGFNHNFRYKDVVFHVQTEDGGIKFPFIITHLFVGGTILKTKKTSYADIIKADRLEQVVEELMKEQHRDMLRRLRSGEYDEVIEKFGIFPAEKKPAAETGPAAAPVPTPAPPPVTGPPAGAPPSRSPQAAAATPQAAPPPAAGGDNSLDDIILSYLLGESGQ